MSKEFSANVFHNLFSNNEKCNPFDKEYTSKDFEYNHSQDESSTLESLAGFFSMAQHGDNYEEIVFTNRMERKKKKPRGPKLLFYKSLIIPINKTLCKTKMI